ncbi:hypothetical protein ACFQE5_08800 [Pseudonocardia hispaniensis]|uniref:Excreted virulence factor EspC (Type VII ESX diderm) n=1 Tax=Pseudonocardia hispaniensis TaxID=904933 RepID=A0ABW1J0T5_9PSEU
MSAADATVAVQLTARSWSVIDATMDNTAANARNGLDYATEDVALAIRQAGQEQVPWVDGQWPPMEQILTIRLSTADWNFAIGQVRQSLERPVDDETESLERTVLEEVTPQLG